ncbi:MAG: ribonuclease J [Bacteriovoracaceae bacterium]|nr:ribonuclease J [Bacteriovoracaceae bacterium]
MSNDTFVLKPIGGLGRIGANMMLLNSGNCSVIIDVGILFPKDDHFGINFLIPDFYKTLKDYNVNDLFITHGHEDHIGAILFILEHIPSIKIHAPRFATNLIRKKLSEAKVSAKIIVYDQNTSIDFDSFTITPFPVNHSIPDTYGAVVIDKKKKFSIGYFSDFKIDSSNKYEDAFNLPELSALMGSTVTSILLTDSTSVLSKNTSTSERDLIPGIEQAISQAKSRVFVTCFASNIFRIQTIIDIASQQKKRVVPYGRAMSFYIKVALELGILTDHDSVLREVATIDPKSDKLVVLLSGCQGEFRGTMRRVAMNDDSVFTLNSSDTFLFSSKTIPGNEINISSVMNSLSEVGVRIITSNDSMVHASGHASADDLLKLYQAVSPKYIVPIHGETFLLRRHMELISSSVDAEGIFVTNGDTLALHTDGNYTHSQGIEREPLIIHGSNTIIDRQAISQRRKLSESGTLFISIRLDSLFKTRPVFEVGHMGLPEAATFVLPEFNQFLQILLKSIKIKSKDIALDEVRVAGRRFFIPHIGYRPLVIVQFV